MAVLGLLRIGIAPSWAGQVGNPVGHTAAPAFTSLAAFGAGTGSQTIIDGTNATSGSGTVGDPWIFLFKDFNSLTGGVTVAIGDTHYAQFIGCRFQSNSTNFNIQTNSGNLTFSYCSVVPLVSLHTVPPNGSWPSASAGLGISYDSGSYSSYVIPHANGFQYGINIVGTGAPVTADHCDVWGFANAITFPTSGTQSILINACWIHDSRNDGGADHTDGPGFLNGNAQPSNVTISNCTIAMIGNTNSVAMQGGTGSPTGNVVSGNYLSGNTDCVKLVGVSTFTNNVFGTDLPWHNGPLQNDYSTQFGNGSGNLWRGNKIKVLAGTTPYASAWSWTAGQDGQYMLPGGPAAGVLSASDWTQGP